MTTESLVFLRRVKQCVVLIAGPQLQAVDVVLCQNLCDIGVEVIAQRWLPAGERKGDVRDKGERRRGREDEEGEGGEGRGHERHKI